MKLFIHKYYSRNIINKYYPKTNNFYVEMWMYKVYLLLFIEIEFNWKEFYIIENSIQIE